MTEAVEEVHVESEDTAREVTPMQFFGPNEDPVAGKDFRPRSVTTAFSDDDADHPDEPDEDGHGNFQHPVVSPPKHPSESRSAQPYDRQDDPASTEEPSDAPEPTSPKPDSPFDG